MLKITIFFRKGFEVSHVFSDGDENKTRGFALDCEYVLGQMTVIDVVSGA